MKILKNLNLKKNDSFNLFIVNILSMKQIFF